MPYWPVVTRLLPMYCLAELQPCNKEYAWSARGLATVYSSLVPRPRSAFRRLKYGKAVEGLEYFNT